ncbi:short-chain dehydrogenase [Bdellovibrio sp. qaytius]|nr:short-chain dehydrogenase [Bdellovibrio sp. qaytius]
MSIINFKDKTAVIIGGGNGVGRGIAISLAAEKVNVVVADVDIASAMAVKDEIILQGHSAVAIKVDATQIESLTNLANETIKAFGSIHILVSTVGAILEKHIDAASDQEWQWMFEMNLMANVRAAKVFVPHLKQNIKSHIVLTGSGGGLFAPPPDMHIGLYSTMKHALTGFAKSLRNELKKFDVGVSLLCPSGVEGKLATTSARSKANFLKVDFDDTTGRQPAHRVLESGESMGKLVVSAIQKNQFYILNKPNETFQALENELNFLKEDIKL